MQMVVGESLHQRADQEQQSGDAHHVAAAHQVGEAPGEEGADEAADQQRCDGEAEAVARRQAARDQVEGRGQSVLRAVHRAAVIAEQETADRGDRDDRADKAHVRAFGGVWTPFRDCSSPCVRHYLSLD